MGLEKRLLYLFGAILAPRLGHFGPHLDANQSLLVIHHVGAQTSKSFC